MQKQAAPLFCYIDSKIPLLPQSKISNLWLYNPVCVGPGQLRNPKDRFCLDAAQKWVILAGFLSGIDQGRIPDRAEMN